LIAAVVDDEVARQPNVGRFSPEKPRTQRVKRRDPHASTLDIQQCFDAPAHFFGCFIRECDSEDSIGLGAPFAYQMRDSVCDDASLARPGPGEMRSGPST
jgi:hypothetical protein